MTTIAELSVPASEFALGETFEQCPDLRIDLLQGVGYQSPGLTNLIWVESGDSDRSNDALRDDGTIKDVTMLADLDGRYLYSIGWRTPVAVAIAVLLEDATMLGGTGENGRWSFRVLFPERDALSIAASLFKEYDLELHIERIYELGRTGEYGEYALTDEQHAALEVALEEGYFKIPRNSTLDDIADDLGISHQALSERLRRAYEILAETALGPYVDDDRRE